MVINHCPRLIITFFYSLMVEFVPPNTCSVPIIHGFCGVKLYMYLTSCRGIEFFTRACNIKSVVVVKPARSPIPCDRAFVCDGKKVYVMPTDPSTVKGNRERSALRKLQRRRPILRILIVNRAAVFRGR